MTRPARLASPHPYAGARPAVADEQLSETADGRIAFALRKPRRDGATYDIEALRCPQCHGRMRILTAITDPPVIRRILGHLGLPTEPTTLAPARDSPEPELSLWSS